MVAESLAGVYALRGDFLVGGRHEIFVQSIDCVVLRYARILNCYGKRQYE